MSNEVAVTVRLPEAWARNLEALTGPELRPDDLAGVLLELADHAQQGVYRPGAWEREWLCQAFGYDWLSNLEADPRHEDIGWQRPIRAPHAGAGEREEGKR